MYISSIEKISETTMVSVSAPAMKLRARYMGQGHKPTPVILTCNRTHMGKHSRFWKPQPPRIKNKEIQMDSGRKSERLMKFLKYNRILSLHLYGS